MADRATVSEKLKTAELCLEAVKQDGMILRLVPRKFKTRELCIEAVKQNGDALFYVPKKYKTVELCIEAIKQNGRALAYVPEKLKTMELCFKAMERHHAANKYVSKIIKKTVKKLIKLGYRNDEKIKNYSIEMLEILAFYIYRNRNFSKCPGSTYGQLLRDILSWRAIKLNRNFEWTDENKRNFLNVNEKLRVSYAKAYNEALSVADELEKRIKNNDDFIKDYMIEITLTPYIKEPFPNEDALYKFCSVISEPESEFSIPIRHEFHHGCYNREINNIPYHLDKSKNLYTEYYDDFMEANDICHAVNLLLDAHEWSLSDIINIDRVLIKVEVTHQNFIEC
jgi:hypothetical protein